MHEDEVSRKRKERDALREAFCPKCNKWYNVKSQGKNHAGH
jgi:hypothetical protein